MPATSTYREAETSGQPTPEKVVVGKSVGKTESTAEVPFTAYEGEYKHPFMVDHFELGDHWQDTMGGFQKEIDSIEGYFKDQISQGKLDNSTQAVKEKMKTIYKLCGIDKTERKTMQIEKLSAYIEFLRKTDHIKLNHERYGR